MLKKEGSRRNGEVLRCVISVVVSRCAGKSGRFLRLLASVVRYVTRVRVSPRKLSGFCMSEAIHGAFASQGMQFVNVIILNLCVMDETRFMGFGV